MMMATMMTMAMMATMMRSSHFQNGHQIERLGLAIDVPADLISTKNYTATLGHKVGYLEIE